MVIPPPFVTAGINSQKRNMESTQNITPIKPVAPYLGGKRYLAKRIIERIEAIPHNIYAEPFVGMGGVFLRRREKPKSEVINDLDREVATFFRILQRHYVQFMDTIKFGITTRAEFVRLANTTPDTLTDLERAARFLYLQRTAYGGKVSGHNFGVSPSEPGRFDITKLAPMLEDLHTRLSCVVIECLPYHEFIRRYDRPETLFYLDPPYWGCEKGYSKDMFARDDFERLAEQLAGIEGRFLLSLNDVPGVRKTFDAFNINSVKTTYTIARGRKKADEVIISGP